jgi:glyceraldehyde 3-phosphate dehydrogenase
MARVAINGLGRIGRATFKILFDYPQLELVAVNDLIPPAGLAYLLKYDSAYGRCESEVTSDKEHLLIDGKKYPIHSEKDPANLPWGELGIDIVFECSGIFTTREQLEKHLAAGARKVILSAPPKGEGVPTIVFGVNQPDAADRILSCASCTTNCITPVVEIMDRHMGVSKAIMSTVHAYTASQALVDTFDKKPRRGRAGGVSFVPTSTGAARATGMALPQFAGKFDGVAVRGPVLVGSIADIVMITRRATSVDEVNAIFREEADSDRYRSILGASAEPLVSADIVGDPRASIVDLELTRVVDGDLVKVMSWYDNEWGYSVQMVKTAARMAEGM